jgi:uncharacterized protein (TIGR03437 family)
VALFLTGVPTDVTNGNTPTAGYFNGARTTGGIPAEVYYLGPQGQYPGLYQLNVRIPSTFHPSGPTSFELEFDAQHITLYHSNTVTLEFQ